MNHLGKSRIPFLFIIDFNLEKPLVVPLSDIDPKILRYDFPGFSNSRSLVPVPVPKSVSLEADPIPFTKYRQAFELVQQHIRRGDSFLLNLTFPTRLSTNLTLAQFFELAEAPYRLWWEDRFSCFSPETFVRIRHGRIFSYPMKGTIAGDGPETARLLLENSKEKAEHATIVDLIRNDLSRVAKQVRVDRFRYPEKLCTRRGGLWQTSSEISGVLPPDYHEQIGDLLFELLPAGSISGAPKSKTVDIIRAAEGYERGYYTGVGGIFDGQHLDSAVLIRFVEAASDGLVFKSGGGITAFSQVEIEYREMLRKVDLPIKAAHLNGRKGAKEKLFQVCRTSSGSS